MIQISLFDQVVDTLGDLAKRHGFKISVRGNLDDPRGAAIDLENDAVIICATREETFVGCEETLWVCCKIRARPRAHLRTYSVGSLAAFIQGKDSPYPLRGILADAKDLLSYEAKILNVDFLNSEDLRQWRVEASRRQFGSKK